MTIPEAKRTARTIEWRQRKNICLNRREAEDGSLRDDVPQWGLGQSPNRPPLRSIPKNENQEAKRPLIPPTPLITAAKRKMGV